MNNIDLDKKVKQLVHSQRYEKGFVCMIDILKGLDCLSNKDYDNWRFGKIEYLEKACKTNLSKLTFIQKSFRHHSLELGLKNPWTAYNQHGIKLKKTLRFSKTGKTNIEKMYSTHYIDNKRVQELKTIKASM